MLLLNTFSWSLSWESSLFSSPIILCFGLCIEFQIWGDLVLTFSLTDEFFLIFYLQCLSFSIFLLNSVSNAWICSSCLSTQSFYFLNFLSFFFFLYYFYFNYSWLRYFPSPVWFSLDFLGIFWRDLFISSNFFDCLFIDFFKRFFLYFFRSLCQHHKANLRFFVFYFNCIGILRACLVG